MYMYVNISSKFVGFQGHFLADHFGDHSTKYFWGARSQNGNEVVESILGTLAPTAVPFMQDWI